MRRPFCQIALLCSLSLAVAAFGRDPDDRRKVEVPPAKQATTQPAPGTQDPRREQLLKNETAPPAKSAGQSVGDKTRELVQGVFLVGGHKGRGTAWTLSRKHRLLVTNAHVADLYLKSGAMQAILNGSATSYTVAKAWYHPGVRRFLDTERFLSVRSADPRDGEVDPASPDVALLQLAPGGPDLPVEFPVAAPEECSDKALFAQRLAILGYPGHDNKRWPAPGEAVEATFHEGSVSRLTNFYLSPNASDADKQFLQYTIPTWNGFSGSPVYLANGHVVAVHNMARAEVSPAGEVRTIPHGVRIDCVWELLRHHSLEHLVAVPGNANLNVQRWLQKDERDDMCRQAAKLVQEAKHLNYALQEHAKATTKCDEALEVMKDYPAAWLVRSHSFSGYYFDNIKVLSKADKLDLLGNALKSVEKYADLAGDNHATAHINVAVVLNNLSNATGNMELNKMILARVDKVLSRKGLADWEYASALSIKAQALSGLSQPKLAAELHLKAVRMCPDQTSVWENFAAFLAYNKGKKEVIDSNNLRAKLLREKRQLLNAHWIKFLETKDKLTASDPLGKVRPKSYAKKHTIQMEQGLHYQIDTFSDDIDTFLRLEDADGNTLAEDDDSGGYLDALIFYQAPKTGTYHIYVSSAPAQQTGTYVLRMQEGRK